MSYINGTIPYIYYQRRLERKNEKTRFLPVVAGIKVGSEDLLCKESMLIA